MKRTIFTVILILLNKPTFAQIVETDPSIGQAMHKLVTGHNECGHVQALKSKIESEYNVSCVGGSTTVFPDITKRVIFKATCQGDQSIELKVISKFSQSKSGFQYFLKSYSVGFLN